MGQPNFRLESQSISLNTNRTVIHETKSTDKGSCFEVRICLESEFKIEWSWIFRVIDDLDVKEIFKSMLILFWYFLFKSTILEGSIPIALDNFSFEIADFFSWFKIVRQQSNFFLSWSTSLNELRSLNVSMITLSRRGLTLAAYLLRITCSCCSCS